MEPRMYGVCRSVSPILRRDRCVMASFTSMKAAHAEMTNRVRFIVGLTLAAPAITFFFWVAATGARWRGGIEVLGADSYPDGRVTLEVDTCHGNPELSDLIETDRSVEVRAVSSWGSLLFGNDVCANALEVGLDEVLRNRDLSTSPPANAVASARSIRHPDAGTPSTADGMLSDHATHRR